MPKRKIQVKRKKGEAVPIWVQKLIESDLRKTSDSIKTIAKRRGVSGSFAVKVNREKGIRPPRAPPKHPIQTKRWIKTALKLEKRTMTEIGRRAGVSRKYAEKINRREEIRGPNKVKEIKGKAIRKKLKKEGKKKKRKLAANKTVEWNVMRMLETLNASTISKKIFKMHLKGIPPQEIARELRKTGERLNSDDVSLIISLTEKKIKELIPARKVAERFRKTV